MNVADALIISHFSYYVVSAIGIWFVIRLRAEIKDRLRLLSQEEKN